MQEQKETTGNNTQVEYAEVEYTKAQIKQAGLFPNESVALINAALEDDKTYTIAGVKKAIEDFKGGM